MIMSTFWDTVLGVELAETLIRELPKLTKRAKIKQTTITIEPDEDLADTIKMYIDRRLIYKDRIQTKDGGYLLIFEE